jgi:hypothetical protein
VTQTILGWLASITLGIIANELCDLSSAPAKRIVRVAARLWARDAEQKEIYCEEWSAYIDDRPGKLLKLLTALVMLGAATERYLVRRTATHWRRQESLRRESLRQAASPPSPTIAQRILRSTATVRALLALAMVTPIGLALTVALAWPGPWWLDPKWLLPILITDYGISAAAFLSALAVSNIQDELSFRELQRRILEYPSFPPTPGSGHVVYSRLHRIRRIPELDDLRPRPYLQSTASSISIGSAPCDTLKLQAPRLVRPYVWCEDLGELPGSPRGHQTLDR